MKILWFCNIILPKIAEKTSNKIISEGGWLTGLSESLLKVPDIALTVAFPYSASQSIEPGTIDNLRYYGFRLKNIQKYNRSIEASAEEIIKQINPDIIHIFGTEYPHTFSIVNICEKIGMINKVLISIQGLVSVYEKHFYANLPDNIITKHTLRDTLKGNIKRARKEYIKRGKYEIQALQKVRHVSGRTDWDRACVLQINPNCEYHFCNEILRAEFYEHRWDIDNCDRYSIFVSQSRLPLKGLHFVLEAMQEVLKKFPGSKLYIAGADITRSDASLMQKLKISYYGVYIKKLISKYKLQEHIVFTGSLNEKEMCERFLKSHVFVSASSVENSPNSLGEAMLLGVPSVSSNVGGVSNMLAHKKEGYTYQYDAPYMLAYYICKLFENDEIAGEFSKSSIEKARVTHNRRQNAEEMIKIYENIAGKNVKETEL